MNDLGIIFLHHKTDAVTINNLNSIKRFHSPNQIVTVSTTANVIEGGASVVDSEFFKQHFNPSNEPARQSDIILYSFYLASKKRFKTWAVLEWDVFLNISLNDYYFPVKDYPFICSNVKLPWRDDEWHWFTHQVPDKYKPYQMGATPFLYVMKNEVLDSVVKEFVNNPFKNGNGEMRLATISNYCDYPPIGYTTQRDAITWIPHKTITQLQKKIYHPIKHIINYETM